MTPEERQLLLKDLCGRAPYGVKVLRQGGNYVVSCVDIEKQRVYLKVNFEAIRGWWTDIEEVKPYLRPLSSMTDDERDEFRNVGGVMSHDIQNDTWALCAFAPEAYDWLNSHHFDYRGLIDRGLALEAPEGMYNKGESRKGRGIPVPKTVDEAISTLEKILSDDDREYLLKNGAISMHDSLGRWIRNEWGLWTGSELKNELMSMNKGLNHPDDMSNYIIEEFIKYWNNKL